MPYLLLAAIIWGLSYGINGGALDFATPQEMALLLCGAGAAIFSGWGNHPSGRGLRLRFLGIGAVQLGWMYFFLQNAYAHLEGHQIAILCLATPIYVCLFAELLQKKFNGPRMLIAVAMVFIAWNAVGGSLGTNLSLRGAIECQLANACYGLGQVLFGELKRRHPELQERTAIFWMFAGGILAVLPVYLILPRLRLVPFTGTVPQLARLGFLCILGGGLGNYWWNKGVARVRIETLLICNNLPPIFGVLFGILLFHEHPHWLRLLCSFLGLALLLGCNAMLQPRKNRPGQPEK
jgi:drug/metabolite transporter (DMT)-like permease